MDRKLAWDSIEGQVQMRPKHTAGHAAAKRLNDCLLPPRVIQQYCVKHTTFAQVCAWLLEESPSLVGSSNGSTFATTE